MLVMAEIHEGLAGAHQSGPAMKWQVIKHGLYWPTFEKDCHQYARGCQECQKHGPVQRVPAEELHSVVRPWPFRAWAMDVIDKIHPSSSRGHDFILVATDYFTKWVEAAAFKNVCDTTGRC